MTPGLPLALTPGLPLGLILGLPFGITPGLAFGLTLGLPFGSHPCNSLCLGRKPKARVATLVNYTRIVEQVCSMLNVLLNH